MTDSLDAAALALQAVPEPAPTLVDSTELDVLVGDPLGADEQRYITAARAPNTLRGYRSDLADFTDWCTGTNAGVDPIPAVASTITGYLTMLATAGATVGTMSRRLSAIKFAHRAADLPDPTDNARVMAVWEGIRRQLNLHPRSRPPR